VSPRALRVCSTPGCPTFVTQGRCSKHLQQADQARGTATERGYNTHGHRRFRAAVLRTDPICVLCQLAVSTVADHHPLSRRELLDQGLDPNDPSRGRGLCKRCHDTHTATAQRGGWNDR
jgi:5-methylcytosine-specific restriction protein A